MTKLKFTFGNSKLPKYIAIFSMPVGFTCDKKCKFLAFANPVNGKISDGKNAENRCYAVQPEGMYPTVRAARWHNYNLMMNKTKAQMIALIQESLPDCVILRLNVAGDFISQANFDAWIAVAKNNPQIKFYAYTKRINFWLARINQIPSNFLLNASLGGGYDDLAIENGLKTVKVVNSEIEAKNLGLEIDHTDKMAYSGHKSFALLIHGMGKAGSVQAKLKRKYGYSKNKVLTVKA